MKRETVLMEDLCHNAKYPGDTDLCMDDWDTIWVIEENQVYYDTEKGFCDYECVFQRKSDEKFFKFTYTQYGHNGDNILEQEAYEVFKKTKTVEYYE